MIKAVATIRTVGLFGGTGKAESNYKIMEHGMTDKRQAANEILDRMFPPEFVAGLAIPEERDFADELSEMGIIASFETAWIRPGLDVRTRSLITVAVLIALRQTSELASHVPAAIRNGATVLELEETFYHVAGYAGFPAVLTARGVAREALKKAGMDT